MSSSPVQQQGSADRRHEGVRKRASNACHRCRQQKIRCSGRHPCEQCTKRNLQCTFESKPGMVLVSREYMAVLEKRAEQGQMHRYSSHDPEQSEVVHDVRAAAPTTTYPNSNDEQTVLHRAPESVVSSAPEHASNSGNASPSAQIDNPFTSHTLEYVADSTGRPWYLGTSSNWAFTRRVLNMAHERITGQPAQLQHLLFDSDQYDLGWDGLRDPPAHETNVLPSYDHAVYLIDAVKFHCGQLFFLFEEASFMQQFYEFHQGEANVSKRKSLWYVHYLLVLAFGKAFVARRSNRGRPPGIELYVEAVKLLPDVTLLHAQPLQAIEVLCCKALYLQCLDFRGPAFNVIGQALRIALEQGMHTNMQGQGLDEIHIQHCRNAWWTIYILDRQMSSIQGAPLAVRDEDISAELPSVSGSLQKARVLELNVKLSRITSRILTTVYGIEGRLSRKFISNTKSALKSIATLSKDLKQSFAIPSGDSGSGISRLSAHLHLLLHQCIVLATRPLLFSFLKTKLDRPDQIPKLVVRQGSARTLLQICIDSSQHVLIILDRLKEQHLLETFLPYDLGAAFAASLVLLLAPVVDPSLLESNAVWVAKAHVILDEMALQGNLQATGRKAELQQLQRVFDLLPRSWIGPATHEGQSLETEAGPPHGFGAISSIHNEQLEGPGQAQLDYNYLENSVWRNGFTADHLMNVADSLDLDGIDWMTTGSSTLTD